MARLAPVEHSRIVVAVGDSDESMHAAALAARLVAASGVLVFVHAIEVPLEFPLDEPPRAEEEPARRRGRHLLGCSQAVAERYGVSSKRILVRRHAAGPAIVEAAEQSGASLIVIPSEQRFSRSGRLRLGPTATYVLKHADCRVIVVTAGSAAAGAFAQVA